MLAAIWAKLESRDVLLLDVTAPVVPPSYRVAAAQRLKMPKRCTWLPRSSTRCDWLLALNRDFPQLDGRRVCRLDDLLDASIELPWEVAVQQTFLAADKVVWLAPRPVALTGHQVTGPATRGSPASPRPRRQACPAARCRR